MCLGVAEDCVPSAAENPSTAGVIVRLAHCLSVLLRILSLLTDSSSKAEKHSICSVHHCGGPSKPTDEKNGLNAF
jgi:hypothetical protein